MIYKVYRVSKFFAYVPCHTWGDWKWLRTVVVIQENTMTFGKDAGRWSIFSMWKNVHFYESEIEAYNSLSKYYKSLEDFVNS